MGTWPVSSEFSKVERYSQLHNHRREGVFLESSPSVSNGIKTGALQCTGRNSPMGRTCCHRVICVPGGGFMPETVEGFPGRAWQKNEA